MKRIDIQKLVLENQDDHWENNDIKYVKCCGDSPERVDVFMSVLVKHKIDLLLKQFPSHEWLAYLIGENNNIHDIYIPHQTVTSIDVNINGNGNGDSDEATSRKNVIGVIHSHHTMATQFSTVDDEGVNKNHNISLLVTHKGMIGVTRLKTKCGAYIIVPVDIKLDYCTNLDTAGFSIDIVNRVTIKEYKFANVLPSGLEEFNDLFKDDIARCGNRKADDLWDIDGDNPFDDFQYKDVLYDDLDFDELTKAGVVKTRTGYRSLTSNEELRLSKIATHSKEYYEFLDSITYND